MSPEAFAQQLLAAPDPVHAIAHLLADHEARIDILMRRLTAVEFANNHRSDR